MRIGRTMEHQKQNVNHIFLSLLIVLLGISSSGSNVVEARLGTSFITHARLLGRQGVEIQKSTDSSSKGAARLLQSVPGKEFYSIKSKGTAPPSGPSHGGNSVKELYSIKSKGTTPPSGPSHGGNSVPFASQPDHPPHALHPSLRSHPTVVYPKNITETESKVKGKKGPVSGPSHGGDSSPPSGQPGHAKLPPPHSPTLAYTQNIQEVESHLKGKSPVSHEGHQKLRPLTNPSNAN